MAKNTKAKKIRSYKVHNDDGVPYLIVKGKFLQNLGMGIGTQLEMIETDNMLIFRKMTAPEASFKEILRLRTTFKRCFNFCEKHLESQMYSDIVNLKEHSKFLKLLKECGQVITTLSVLTINENQKSNALDIINEYKRQLAWCEQAFCEDRRTVLTSIDLSQIEKYKILLTLLKDCGKQLGIFTKRNLFSFKNKRQIIKIDDHVRHYPYGVKPTMMMVAENSDITYSVDDELAKRPERYNQLNENQI